MNTLKRLVCGAAFVLAASATMAQSFNEYFVAEKKFLRLPVKNGAPKRNLEIWKDGVKVRFFDMELADGQADWYAYLDLSEWKGKKIELRVDKMAEGSKALSPLHQTDKDATMGTLYKEPFRGQLHFSPKQGWMNDPNGLVYYKGQYHMFFQYNPYGRDWGNMTWGHAVSNDLLHWKELDPIIHPDGFGPMFSGSAVVDSLNTSGLGKPGDPALVMYFTGATCWCQGMTWSNDGINFKKLDYAPVPRVNSDNRDPKVFWYEPGKHWVMLFWVPTNEGVHTQHFFKSADLKNWTPTSVLMGGKGDDRYLFECPDFFELAVDDNPNNKKWVISAANAQYSIGTFDGSTFKPEQERLRGQLGRSYWAAQSINNEPTGRRIEIGWWHTKTNKDGMNFTGSMTIPMELKLVTTPEGVRMIRVPVKEMESLRTGKLVSGVKTVSDKSANPLEGVSTDLMEVETVIEVGKSKEIRFNLNGLEIVYDVAAQEIDADGVKAKIPLQKGLLQLRIFVDRIGVELFANNGLIYMPIDKNLSGKSSSLKVTGGKAKFRQLDVYSLKSIWQ